MDLNVSFADAPTVSRYMQSDARHRLIVGPFGSGKTVGSIFELPRRAAMQKPSPNGKRKSRWAVVRNTTPQLRDTTMKSFFDWFPNGSIGHYVSTTKTYHITQGDIDAEICFRALDDSKDVANLLGMELTGANLAEFREIAREIFEALDGRIGRFPKMADGGPSWVGIWGDSNMPEEESYWYCLMEGKDPENPRVAKPNSIEVFRQPPAMIRHASGERESRRVWYTESPYAENRAHLIPGYYTNLVKDKTEDFIRVNALVEYGRTKGGLPVHPEFDRAIHVSQTPLIPNKHLVLVIGMDFGLTPAMVFKQQDAFGRVLTLDEIVTFDMGLERAMDEKCLPLLRKKYQGFEVVVIGDPSGVNRAQGDETSCFDILRQYKRKGILRKVTAASTNAPVDRRGATDHYLIRKNPPTYLVDADGAPITVEALAGKFAFKRTKDGRHSEDVDKNDWSHIGEANEYGDMYFREGGRVKADLRDQDWADLVRDQNRTSYSYASPRA